MNPIEQAILNFLISTLKANPQFLDNIIKEILTQNKVDPAVIQAVLNLVNELLPLLLAGVPNA
jgi:hypothetical protein